MLDDGLRERPLCGAEGDAETLRQKNRSLTELRKAALRRRWGNPHGESLRQKDGGALRLSAPFLFLFLKTWHEYAS